MCCGLWEKGCLRCGIIRGGRSPCRCGEAQQEPAVCFKISEWRPLSDTPRQEGDEVVGLWRCHALGHEVRLQGLLGHLLHILWHAGDVDVVFNGQQVVVGLREPGRRLGDVAHAAW
jgi:hypothetical protein